MVPRPAGAVVVDLAAERLRRRAPWPWEWEAAPPCEGVCTCYGVPLGGVDPGQWAR
jgi:hypothetical protein